jgi:hypothetical protein
MKRLLMTLSVLAVFVVLATPVMAQRATSRTKKTTPVVENFSGTPEMWLYQQYQRDYNDPKVAVRRNAEFARNQRQRRLASMKWFGFSNQRPSAISDPYHGGTYSPTWTGNNSLYPYRWSGTGQSLVIVKERGR